MTIYEIKRRHEELGGNYYFSRKTMKFFKQTLKDFRVSSLGDNKYLITAPMKWNGKIVGYSKNVFDYNTGNMSPGNQE